MPIDTQQVANVVLTDTFTQLVNKTNEVISIVNGLPATTTGAIARAGGTIDGTSGPISAGESGSLFVINDGKVLIGDFLGTNQPTTSSGKLQVHSASSNAVVYISQNTSTKSSAIVFQRANATSWAGAGTSDAKSGAVIGLYSNTATPFSKLILAAANTVDDSTYLAPYAFGVGDGNESAGARLIIDSGEEYEGANFFFNAPARFEHAVGLSPYTSNTVPNLTVIGDSAVNKGCVARAVRLVIADANILNEENNPFASIDFMGDGATYDEIIAPDVYTQTNEANKVQARISVVAGQDSGHGARMYIGLAGYEAGARRITAPFLFMGEGDNNGGDGKLLLANTAVANAYGKAGSPYATANSGQLILRATTHDSSGKDQYGYGLMIAGDDTPTDTHRAFPSIRMHNPRAQVQTNWTLTGSNPLTGGGAGTGLAHDQRSTGVDTGRWIQRITGGSSDPGAYTIGHFPYGETKGYQGFQDGANTVFKISALGSSYQVVFGGSESQRAPGGTSVYVQGGTETSAEGGQININASKGTYISGQTVDGRHQHNIRGYHIDMQANRLRFFPNVTDVSDAGYTNIVDSALKLWKPTNQSGITGATGTGSANTLMGFGGSANPGHTVHIIRNYEYANVVVETSLGRSGNKPASILVRDVNNATGYNSVANTKNFVKLTAAPNWGQPQGDFYASGADTDARVPVVISREFTGAFSTNHSFVEFAPISSENMRLQYNRPTAISTLGSPLMEAQYGLSQHISFRNVASGSGSLRAGDGSGSEKAHTAMIEAVTYPSTGAVAAGIIDTAGATDDENGSLVFWGNSQGKRRRVMTVGGNGGVAIGANNYPRAHLHIQSMHKLGERDWAHETDSNLGNPKILLTNWNAPTDLKHTVLSWQEEADVATTNIKHRGSVLRLQGADDNHSGSGNVLDLHYQAGGSGGGHLDTIQIGAVSSVGGKSQIGIWTSANNSSSSGWQQGYGAGSDGYSRIGVGNSFPAYAITAQSDHQKMGGVASFGNYPVIRLVQGKPGATDGATYTYDETNTTNDSRKSYDRSLITVRPTIKPNKEWALSVYRGELSIGQNQIDYKPSDTYQDYASSNGSSLMVFHANNEVSNVYSVAAERVGDIALPRIGKHMTKAGGVGLNRFYGGTGFADADNNGIIAAAPDSWKRDSQNTFYNLYRRAAGSVSINPLRTKGDTNYWHEPFAGASGLYVGNITLPGSGPGTNAYSYHHTYAYTPGMEDQDGFGPSTYDEDFATIISPNSRPVPGLLPVLNIEDARPIASGNGAHLVIAKFAGTSGNSHSEGNHFTNEISLRRFKEEFSDAQSGGWTRVAWFDGIGIDNSYRLPMPNIGLGYSNDSVFGLSTKRTYDATSSEAATASNQGPFKGGTNDDGAVSMPGSETVAEFQSRQASRVWWERRPTNGVGGEANHSHEFSESHMWGSATRHVMTVHANSMYQGVHAELGGFVGDNAVLAAAKIYPRGSILPLGTTGNHDALPDPPHTPTIQYNYGFSQVTRMGISSAFWLQFDHPMHANNYAVSMSISTNMYQHGTSGDATSTQVYDDIYGTSPGKGDYGAIDQGVMPSHIVLHHANTTGVVVMQGAMRGENKNLLTMTDENEFSVIVVGRANTKYFTG